MTEPVTVSPDAISAAALGPAPLTDAELIAHLRQELAAKSQTVATLREKLAASERKLASRPVPFRGCVRCAGLRETVAAFRREARALHREIARLRFGQPPTLTVTMATDARSEPGL